MLQHREGEKESNNRSSHLMSLSTAQPSSVSEERSLSLVNHNESSLLSRELKSDIFIFLRKCIQIS